MTYKVEITTIKPAGVEFFGTANPTVNGKPSVPAKAQPGFISRSIQKPDENTMVKTLEFDTKESFEAYDAKVKANTESGYLQKKEYNRVNNIVSTRKVLS
jgi:hypothetical protein